MVCNRVQECETETAQVEILGMTEGLFLRRVCSFLNQPMKLSQVYYCDPIQGLRGYWVGKLVWPLSPLIGDQE